MQDEGGTEDFHIYAVTIATGETRDLTPLAGVQARIHDLSLDEPNVVAIDINDRDKSWHDLYRIDIAHRRRASCCSRTGKSSPASCSTASCARGSPPRRARRKAAASATASTAASSSRSASSSTRTI